MILFVWLYVQTALFLCILEEVTLQSSFGLIFVFQCNLPNVEECMRLAEATQADGDIFETMKYYLLSTEPERALPIGIQYVKGKHLNERTF